MRWNPFASPIKIETRDQNLLDEDGVLAALWAGQASGSSALYGESAIRVPAVVTAVSVISEAAACLPVRIMERAEDGKEIEDLNHPIGVMLRGDVNGWASGFELIRDLIIAALTLDCGGIAFVNRVGNEVREIIYSKNMVTVTYGPMTGEPTYRINGTLRQRNEILHVRGPFGKSPLTLAAEAIGTAKVMETHACSLFKNGGRPGGVIKTPKPLGDEGVKKMIKAWRTAHDGADKTGKTAILWDNAEFQQMMLNSVDSQFLELRKFQIIEIARAFHVPPSMLFDLDRATWSNSEQMGREFLTYTLEPWLRVIETAFTRALFTKEERKRFRVLLDRDDLTRADLTARATAISSLISSRVLNPNEGRSWLDMQPYDGGDVFANPNTGASQPGEVGKSHDDQKPKNPRTEDDDKETDDDA